MDRAIQSAEHTFANAKSDLLCPAIDHTWVKPICDMTSECCESCTLAVDPLLNCMIDNIVMKNTIINEEVDESNQNLFCFDDIEDDVCEDVKKINDSNHNRRRLEEAIEKDGITRMDESSSSSPIETDLDLNSTTTTEYLQYCFK